MAPPLLDKPPHPDSVDDTFHDRLHRSLRHKESRIWTAVAYGPAFAFVLSVSAFLFAHPGLEVDWSAHGIQAVAREWREWSWGWAAGSTEIGAMTIGLLTAALTLFIATSVTALDRERTSIDGIASRLLLDDLNRLLCLFGSVAAWFLAAGAGWSGSSALACAAAGVSGVILAILAACAENRPLAADYQRWTLNRAEAALRRRAGLAPLGTGSTDEIPSPRRWVRAFPWRWAFVLATAASLPAIVRMVAVYPDDLSRVLPLSGSIVLVGVALLCAAWSWRSDLLAARVRSGRVIPFDAATLGIFLVVIFTLVGGIAVIAGSPWGLLSFALLVATGAMPWLVGLDAGLRERDLLRTLASVRAARPRMPIPEPDTTQPSEPSRRWTLELGSLRITRYDARPPG